MKDAFSGKLLDLLFPPRCPFCRALLRDHEKLLCTSCRTSLPWTQGAAQSQRFRHLEACVSPLYYEGDVRRSLLRYKFHGLSVYAPKYAAVMAECVRENGLSFEKITWAPLGRKRLRKRGYDQARLLAEALGEELGLPCERLLEKTIDNPPQSGTASAKERRANVAGIYRFSGSVSVKGQSILLVDDIVTTGATLSECGRVLRAAGAKQISAATLARGRA